MMKKTTKKYCYKSLCLHQYLQVCSLITVGVKAGLAVLALDETCSHLFFFPSVYVLIPHVFAQMFF